MNDLQCSRPPTAQPDPAPGCDTGAELLDVPEPDVVTVYLLLTPVRLACPSPGGAATRTARCAGPAPSPPGSRTTAGGLLPAPAVERGPRHPQLGGHLLDRQQRVIGGTGSCSRGWRGRPGAVRVPGGGPSVGPPDARSAPPRPSSSAPPYRSPAQDCRPGRHRKGERARRERGL